MLLRLLLPYFFWPTEVPQSGSSTSVKWPMTLYRHISSLSSIWSRMENRELLTDGSAGLTVLGCTESTRFHNLTAPSC